MLHIVRLIFYIFLLACSTVLLALTGYRINHTKGFHNVDFFTGRTHFYEPIIVELLVTSILAIIISLYFLSAISGRVGRMGNYASEHVCLFVIWVMFLVGAAIQTHQFPHLKQCRGFSKQCRTLETIKAFAWICWCLTFFLIFASLGNMGQRHVGLTGPAHGWNDGATGTRNTGTATLSMRNQPGTTPATAAPAADAATAGNQGATTAAA